MSTKIRRAVKEHRCTERNYHTIKVGDLYLNAVCPPWSDVNNGKKWWVIKACLRCAKEFGMLCSETRKQLETLESGRAA
jgi:hypothetical protein